MKPTKEQLAELMGMADLLEAKLEDADMEYEARDVGFVSQHIRIRFNTLCGEEELARLRGEIHRCETCKYNGDSQYQSYCCSCKNGVDEDFYEPKE